MAKKAELVYGDHNSGAVVTLGLHEQDGKAKLNLLATEYTGQNPTKDQFDARVKQLTGCEAASAVSNVRVYIKFEEIGRTCPNAHDIEDGAIGTEIMGATFNSHHVEAKTAVLGRTRVLLTKMLGLGQEEINSAGIGKN